MTLDHVAPRRGLTAYDRRDNLVLACPGCNQVKRDQAPLAFLLGSRMRAFYMLKYGGHLSGMLVDMARSLVPEEMLQALEEETRAVSARVTRSTGGGWATLPDLDDESPYRD